MKPFDKEAFRCGPFNVVFLRGDAGAWIEYDFTEDHAQEEHPNIIVFVKGAFVRYRMDDPSERLSFILGDTNDRIGARKKGVYRLEAETDDTLHICVSAVGKAFRPRHERIDTAVASILPMGQLAVLLKPDVGSVIYAETKDASIDGPSIYERFSAITMN